MDFKYTSMLGIFCSVFSAHVSAATYTNLNGETPFDITLTTDGSSWSGNTPTLQSTDTTSTHPHSNSTSEIIEETTPAQIGIDGLFEVINVTTTTTYDHTINTQQAFIDFNDSITGQQQTDASYSLSGLIQKQAGETLYDTNGWINFSLDLGVSFDATPSDVSGMLTFEFGTNPDEWAFSYQTQFDSIVDSMSLFDSHSLNFTNDIYFTATYDIFGSTSTLFDINNIGLEVNTYVDSDSSSNFSTSETRTVLGSFVIPAEIAPVPVPAAVWLMLSGLLGLTAVARRRQS